MTKGQLTSKATRKQLRDFGLMMAGFFAVLTLLRYLRHHTWNHYLIGIGLVFLALGLLVPQSLGPFYRVWMKFGRVLGWVNSRVLLFLIFYLVVTPVGVLRRLFQGDPLKRSMDKSATTYWEPANTQTTPESLDHLY